MIDLRTQNITVIVNTDSGLFQAWLIGFERKRVITSAGKFKYSDIERWYMSWEVIPKTKAHWRAGVYDLHSLITSNRARNNNDSRQE
jgi:hypothetical protein